MCSNPSLLGLPRELRDIIYRFYLFDDGGYHYEYESQKFRTANGEAIDISLARTCRCIAHEMRYLALELNVLVFTTGQSDQESFKAGSFGRVMEAVARRKHHFTSDSRLRNENSIQFLSQDNYREIARRYPRFEPLLERWRQSGHGPASDSGLYGDWGEAPSTFLSFMDSLLGRMEMDPSFVAKKSTAHMVPFGHFSQVSALLSKPALWDIPTEQEMTNMLVQLDACFEEYALGHIRKGLKQMKWRWSAAAVAIRFLQCSCDEMLRRIRKIRLHEDQSSVALPHYHIRGLLPFCSKYPQLVIEHRVSIWRTVIPLQQNRWSCIHPSEYPNFDKDLRRLPFCLDFPRALCPWICEALALRDLGAAGTYELTFDPDSNPSQCSELFSFVKRHAAWQAAQDHWCAAREPSWWNGHELDFWEDRHGSNQWTNRRLMPSYLFENAPEVIANICNGSRFIHCDFPVGEPPNLELVIDATSNLETRNGWCNAFKYGVEGGTDELHPQPPIPSWQEMLKERRM